MDEPTHSPDLPPPLPAPIGLRCIAFVLDAILIFLIAFFLLNKIALPQAHPDAQEHIQAMNDRFVDTFKRAMNGEDVPPLEPTPEFIEVSNFMSNFVLMTAWAYLSLSELLTAGSSLGKKVFRLQTVSSRTGMRPNFIETLSRSLFKALSLIYPPLALQFLIAFFNKQHKAGHDYICNTMVSEPRRTRDILKPL